MNIKVDNFYARKNENDELQTLSDHLQNVAVLASSFSRVTNTSKLSGLFHDLGKATTEFQNYLLYGGQRGSVPHSLQGAFFVDDIFHDDKQYTKILKELLGMIISAHHSRLPDGLSPDGNSMFSQKLERKDEERLYYKEIQANSNMIMSNYNGDIDGLFQSSILELENLIKKIMNKYKALESAAFALGLFVKYIYSCLIDADWLDAYLFNAKKQYQSYNVDWNSLINTFENNIKGFKNDNEIGRARRYISEKCKESSTRETGIYQLSVPTGGGKTLSSMRFALHHAKKYNKKRIIYVIPYLSIIEQTAKSLRDILDLDKESSVILEHHSNVVLPEDDEEKNFRKLAASRWDSPIIITTMVQFLETVMSSRAGMLRKFHSMEEAIIIFDEIQFLPINSIHLFNEVVNFLSNVLETTILLCTATQPLIGKTNRENLMLADKPNLINGTEDCFSNLKRTKIVIEQGKDISEFADFIQEQAEVNLNCLVIVNTKKAARELYQKIVEVNKEYKIFHLSTSMCSTHRFNVLEQVKNCLNNQEQIICISTQLIEAGVDISFSCVIRAMAGLDSILQAAGRCNRNGESTQPKNVYVIPLKDENLEKLQDIKIGKDIASRVFNENSDADFISQEILNQFYEYFFFQRKNIMDYPTDEGESIYKMLSINKIGKINYKNITGKLFNHQIGQAFSTADEHFHVISKNSQPVIVYYEESEKLIEEYKNEHQISKKIAIIKKLEKYSVSIYRDYEFKILNDNRAISILDDEFGLHILDKNYYNKNVGVVLKISSNDFIV